jgi:hypothetical protein
VEKLAAENKLLKQRLAELTPAAAAATASPKFKPSSRRRRKRPGR